MACDHVHKVAEWGIDRENGFATIVVAYGCTKCDQLWDHLPRYEEDESSHDHEEFVWGCFACKVATLQMNTGDAGRADSMPQKKWDKELADYKKAREQGIQPEGTSAKAIQAAVAASDTLGTAFNADTMGSAKKVTKAKKKIGA
jgi:hypothetical protein